MNSQTIVVFDFETGGLNPNTCPPIQIAALAIDARTLEPMVNGTFSSLMCPPDKDLELIEESALAKNKKTMQEIRDAPPWILVWKRFTRFINSVKTGRGQPIPAGQNIKSFDLIISDRLCKLYGPWDKTNNEQKLWDKYDYVDLKNLSFAWFENLTEPASYGLDTLRDFFGMSKENAHDALQDVKDTAAIMIRFLQLHRSLSKKISFKGALTNA
jgi:DNA polymerase III epsilon subunit-like protein